MSHSVYVYISSIESLETIAAALSSLIGSPLTRDEPDSDQFGSEAAYPGTEDCWVCLSRVDDSSSDLDEDLLLTQYQFEIRIDGGARADQTWVGCELFRVLKRTGRYRVLLLTNDGQIENDRYDPGPIKTHGIWDYELRSLWKERGASAALDEPPNVGADHYGEEAAWRLFHAELEALGAPAGREAEWAGSWHIGAKGKFYRTDQQAQALALFLSGWSHARHAGQYPGYPPVDEPKPERRMSAVVSRQRCVAQVNEPGVTGTRWVYLRTHRDGSTSIPRQREEYMLHFDDDAQAQAWLVEHGYNDARGAQERVSAEDRIERSLA